MMIMGEMLAGSYACLFTATLHDYRGKKLIFELAVILNRFMRMSGKGSP